VNTTAPKTEANGRVAPVTVRESYPGVEEDVAALTLDDHGVIYDCNHAGEALFKYRRCELVCRPVSVLLPQLAELQLITSGHLNPYLRFLSRIGHHFHAVTQDGERFRSKLFLNLVDSPERGYLSLMVRPVE